jgi:hypothetical protein
MIGLALLLIGAAVPEARVSGVARQTASICRGGAAVTREDYESLPPPTPLAGLTFFVRRGAKITRGKPFAQVTTNAKGRFELELPEGTWCFYDAGRALRGEAGPVAARPDAHIDAQCLAEEKVRCDLVVRVAGERKGLVIERAERCPRPWAEPCYRGPMPP